MGRIAERRTDLVFDFVGAGDAATSREKVKLYADEE
jgi:hypothetical protein